MSKKVEVLNEDNFVSLDFRKNVYVLLGAGLLFKDVI